MPPHGLQFPRPVSLRQDEHAASDILVDGHIAGSSHGGAPETTTRHPPPNFASMRSAARQLRASKQKSPFVPKKVQRIGHANRALDVDRMSLDELRDLHERNERLLSSMASTGDAGAQEGSLIASRVAETQARVEERIESLEQKQSAEDVRLRLERAHIDNNHAHTPRGTIATSNDRTNSGLTSALSMNESLELQRQAAQRAADEQAQAEREAQQRSATKQALLSSKEINARMMNFIFADGDDSDEDDDSFSEGDLREHVRQHDDEDDHAREMNPSVLEEHEDAALNPYRTAYTLGWNLARREEEQHAEDTILAQGSDSLMAQIGP